MELKVERIDDYRVEEILNNLDEIDCFCSKIIDDDIKSLIEKLWPAYVLNQKSDYPINLGKSESLFEMRIKRLIQEENTEKEETPFDVFNNFLSIRGLLISYTDDNFVDFFVLDSCCENIISQIYQDRDEHFISRYKELAEVAARIRGACYGRFMRNPIFTRAYLINKICYCIYGTEYPYDKDDIFVEWLNKNAIHHYLSANVAPYRHTNVEVKALYDLYKEIVIQSEFAKEYPDNDKIKRDLLFIRIKAVLILSGRRMKAYTWKQLSIDFSVFSEEQNKEINELLKKCKEYHDNNDSCSSIDEKISSEVGEWIDIKPIFKKYDIGE